jgi:hypothetical protein
MRTLFVAVCAVLLLAGLAAEGHAQASVNQNVTLAVNPIYLMAVSGDPAPLTITTGVAGSDVLTPVSDNSTDYSMTQNVAGTVKITAEMDAALAAGYTLEVNLASTQGTSQGDIDISNATSGSAVDVVTGIAMGADANQTIQYTFGALASAGQLAATTRVVTLTLTN